MVQQMAMKTAAKMSEKSVIEAKNIRVYAYGLELLFSSLVGVAAVIIISAVFGKIISVGTVYCRFCTATIIWGRIPCKNPFPLYFRILLAFFPYPANRETICDPGESVVNCLLCKSCYHFFVLTGGSNQ